MLVALPGNAVAAVAESLGDALDEKVVIDATNNIGAPEMNSISAITGNAPRALAARAFNTLGWENFGQPDFGGSQADLLWCGPDGNAGAMIEKLIADVGLRPVRVGSLEQLNLVDMVAGRWFALVRANGGNRRLAFKVLTG